MFYVLSTLALQSCCAEPALCPTPFSTASTPDPRSSSRRRLLCCSAVFRPP